MRRSHIPVLVCLLLLLGGGCASEGTGGTQSTESYAQELWAFCKSSCDFIKSCQPFTTDCQEACVSWPRMMRSEVLDSVAACYKTLTCDDGPPGRNTCLHNGWNTCTSRSLDIDYKTKCLNRRSACSNSFDLSNCNGSDAPVACFADPYLAQLGACLDVACDQIENCFKPLDP